MAVHNFAERGHQQFGMEAHHRVAEADGKGVRVDDTVEIPADVHDDERSDDAEHKMRLAIDVHVEQLVEPTFKIRVGDSEYAISPKPGNIQQGTGIYTDEDEVLYFISESSARWTKAASSSKIPARDDYATFDDYKLAFNEYICAMENEDNEHRDDIFDGEFSLF